MTSLHRIVTRSPYLWQPNIINWVHATGYVTRTHSLWLAANSLSCSFSTCFKIWWDSISISQPQHSSYLASRYEGWVNINPCYLHKCGPAWSAGASLRWSYPPWEDPAAPSPRRPPPGPDSIRPFQPCNKNRHQHTILSYPCGVGAQGDTCIATISDLLCSPAWFLIIPALSTRALWPFPAETSSNKSGEIWRGNGRWMFRTKYFILAGFFNMSNLRTWD
jgi:hypothetical protein